ncbi:DinB family protein [Caldimonas brevitalea]|uniref:Damage-inducible protein DinB n=1 Tax=Caldimonas brevitalea TaxID=413882 RepID=A0A0G3BXW0_9BURK|nr:DinB family protein [Caldimonas brevitalea]AKJ32236.1 damage-inducible protein DinB [Caldimonas brevitalea]
MPSLSHHLLTCACNNRWANHRLLQACAKLGPHGFAARRTSFFPSVKATLNHILTVDWYYIDAIERSLRGQPPNDAWRAYFDPAEPYETCTELAAAQQACDERLINVCRRLTDEVLALQVPVPREEGLKPERLDRLLAHLLQHQIHHRGQVHAMLAGTDIPPPQLDEFFCASDAALRAGDFEELGFRESVLWETPAPPSRRFDARP